MSDLDKAIRARLERVRANMTAHYAIHADGCVDSVWNDAGELAGAVQQLLDWANDLETALEGAESIVGKAFGNQIRQIIAASLELSPVSSQDTPAPRPAREWKPGDTALWRGREVDIIGVSTDGSRVAIDDLGEVLFDRDVTELSESPSTQGGER